MYLPHTTSSCPPSQQPETPLLHGQGCILLVDDEPPLVRIGHDMLVSLGYDVVARTSAREALAVFELTPTALRW